MRQGPSPDIGVSDMTTRFWSRRGPPESDMAADRIPYLGRR